MKPVTLGLALCLFLAGTGSANHAWKPLKAGLWRWQVKTLQDSAAGQINASLFTNPKRLTIRTARSKRTTVVLSKNTPRGAGPEEFTVYKVTGRAKKIKLESDGDYHLVLVDSKNRELGVEIVHPDFASSSSHLTEFRDVRSAVNAAFGINPTASSWSKYRDLDMRSVTVVGVGFFDFRNAGHQSPGTETGFEIHPVTGFK